MQIQTNLHPNVSFKGITKTIVPTAEFRQAGYDVTKDIIVPYAKKFSDDFAIFVGSPNFPDFLSKFMQVAPEKAISMFKKLGANTVPEYFSDAKSQPLFIVTGKKDVARIKEFKEKQKAWWNEVKEIGIEVSEEKGVYGQMADLYGEFCAYMAVKHRFLKQFGAEVKEKMFGEIKSSMNKKN